MAKRRNNGMMLLRGPATALVVLGLLGSPVASVYCPGDDPAAMACCQRDTNDCNTPGKDDDCCRTVPTDGEAVAVVAKAGDLTKPQSIAAPAAIMPVLALAAAPRSMALDARASRITVGFSPPPFSVLRI